MAQTTDGVSLAIAVPFTKATEAEDGTVYVEGLATDDNLDLDEQVIDADFAAKGMDAWFRDWGNVRQMHSSNLPPAGKAVEMQKRAEGIWVRAHVVEPTAVKLVQEGVYKAFSVGISKPRIVQDLVAKGGRVVDGIFSEISLVDFPANPRAKFQLAKRASNGEVEIVEKAVEPELKKVPTPAEVFGKSAKENVPDTEKPAAEAQQTEQKPEETVTKAAEAEQKPAEPEATAEGEKTAKVKKGFTDEQVSALAAQLAEALGKSAPAAPEASTPELTKDSALYKGVVAIVEEAVQPLKDENKTLREANDALEKRLSALEAAPDPADRAYRGSALGALRSQAQETTAGRGDEAEAAKLEAVVMKARHPSTEISRPAYGQLVKMVGREKAAELTLG